MKLKLSILLLMACSLVAHGQTISPPGRGNGGSGGSATNALTRISTNGVLISGSVTQLDIVGPFTVSNSSGRVTLFAPNYPATQFLQANGSLYIPAGASFSNILFYGAGNTFPTGQKLDTVTVSNVLAITDSSGVNNYQQNAIANVWTLTGPGALAVTWDALGANTWKFGIPVVVGSLNVTNRIMFPGSPYGNTIANTGSRLVFSNTVALAEFGSYDFGLATWTFDPIVTASIAGGAISGSSVGVSGTVTASGFVSTGAVSRLTFPATNGNYNQFSADQNPSESLTNWVGLYYFTSGGTNHVDMNRFDQVMLTNNMATNITLWLTNVSPGKRFAINILGPTNGNNYTLTLYSANSWLMAWDRNCATNGGTGSILTVTNNQSLEIDGWVTKTPTNPIINMVWGRKSL